MIGRRLGIALAAAAFVLLVVGSYAVAGPRDGPPKVPDSKKFEARLNGFQEVPSVSTDAFGRLNCSVRKPADQSPRSHVMIAPSAPAVTSSPLVRNSTAITAPSCSRSVSAMSPVLVLATTMPLSAAMAS